MAFTSDAQGSDVNIVEQENNTSLLYAVRSNLDESGVFALIDAGADVNELDDERKTPLFYAVQGDKENVVRVLIEKGKASVNARDIFGRTSLFYAMTKSQTLIHYLLDKKSSINFKDNCNVSILSFFIENCMSNYSSLASQMSEGINLLIGRGVKRRTVFETLINVVFCKSLFLFTCGIDLKTFSLIMELAKTYVTEEKDLKESMIDDILEMMREAGNDRTLCTIIIPKILDSLFDIGADPNSADSDGNTALHYATRLPFYGVSQETVMDILMQLESFGVMFNAKNHKNETCLLFYLSEDVWELACKDNHDQLSKVKKVVEICRFLLERGSRVEETTRRGDSVFHLILRLFQHLLKWYNNSSMEYDLNEEMIKVLQCFSRVKVANTISTIYTKDSPLHLWASLEPAHGYFSSIYQENQSFEKLLKQTLECLLTKCGLKLDEKNKDGRTPLYLCRTWTAVKLLLDKGALNQNDVDLSGCSPLIVAAKNKTFFQSKQRFYPDVLQEPKDFWTTALKKGFALWAVDKHGESLLSILIESEALDLAKALIKICCEKNYLQSDTVTLSLLNAICKNISTLEDPHWKSKCVEMVLKARIGPICGIKTELNSPLHLCCRNIIEVSKYSGSVDELKTCTHWTIVELLLTYKADCRIRDGTGQSCLDIAESCPALKDLLKEPINIDEVPNFTRWKRPISKKHNSKLTNVSKSYECKVVKQFWYHQDHIAEGSSGCKVYAGIIVGDGAEIAIKFSVERANEKKQEKEIATLVELKDCEHVVRYHSSDYKDSIFYVISELMEGDLENFHDEIIPYETKKELCKQPIEGLIAIHGQNILHCNIKPSNILYKTQPKYSLKIDDFGLSRRIGCTMVYSNNAETRCWIAPEVLKTPPKDHSKSSDIFACGLVLHYILSVKRHPFAPDNCANKSVSQIKNETEANLKNNNMKGWDNSLCPEATHLIKIMLDSDESKRPSAKEALAHPMFWTKKKKIDLLFAVGNQPEFKCPRAKRPTPLTAVETDLETSFSTIVKYVTWNDPKYVHMPAIYTEMMKKRKTPYDTHYVVELVRLIRNAIAHVSEYKGPTPFRKQLLEDFVFLEYFPNLVMEVYKAVTTHGWDQREEIKYKLN